MCLKISAEMRLPLLFGQFYAENVTIREGAANLERIKTVYFYEYINCSHK